MTGPSAGIQIAGHLAKAREQVTGGDSATATIPKWGWQFQLTSCDPVRPRDSWRMIGNQCQLRGRP